MKLLPSRVPIGAIVAAALGALPPGIDPIYLTILSQAGGAAPGAHGWVVGATQGGMAAGALIVWRCRPMLPARPAVGAALAATLLTLLAVPIHGDLPLLLLARALFGVATGIVYTDAMSTAATHRPTTAYAAVFLTQLLLSSLVALTLPLASGAAGPTAALALLALAPALAAVIAARAPGIATPPGDAPQPAMSAHESPPAAAWLIAFAVIGFICATMMVWSTTGAMAMRHGLGGDTIGLAVSAGSIVGAATAVTLFRERRIVPLPVTGVLASIGLVAPLVLTPSGDAGRFVLGILLLNIGSTAIIIRASGAASAAGDSPPFRRFVACTHPLGMIAGPLLGAVLSLSTNDKVLIAGVVMVLAWACAALFATARRPLAGHATGFSSRVQKNN